MPVLTITLLAAILLAVALPLAVYGLVPARAGVDPPAPRPLPARAPGAPAAETQELPRAAALDLQRERPHPARTQPVARRVSARSGRSPACCASN